MDKNRFDHESIQDNETIATHLQALVDGFNAGRITFSSESESVTLIPDNLLKFEVKARTGEGKNKLSLKISWKEPEGKKQKGETMSISS